MNSLAIDFLLMLTVLLGVWIWDRWFRGEPLPLPKWEPWTLHCGIRKRERRKAVRCDHLP